MKIDVDADRTIRLREVFNGVLLETEDGEKLGICMRDSGFEISILDTSMKNPPGVKTEYYNHYTACGGQITQIVCEGAGDMGPCEGQEPKGA